MTTAQTGVSRRDVLKGFGLSPFVLALGMVPESMRGIVEANEARFAQMFQEETQSVESLGDQLVEIIREICRSQVEFWQRVPALALEYDGRDGYSGHMQLAYSSRLWELDIDGSPGRSGCCVDLETGELVSLFRNTESGHAPLVKQQVLKLTFDMQQLDAQAILNWMTEHIQQPYPGYFRGLADGSQEWTTFYDPDEQALWRAEKRSRYNLPQPQV